MPVSNDMLRSCPCRQWRVAAQAGITVGQHLEELLQLYDHLPARVEHVLEIGTHHGGWLFMLASAIPAPARFCAVDPVGCAEIGWVQADLRQAGFDVALVERRSADALPAIRQWLDGASLDVLHLDGAHKAAAVGLDWEMYAPLVRPGGIVSLHDIAASGPEAQAGPRRLFEALQHTHQTHVCQVLWGKGLGIGVVESPGG